MFSYRFCAEVKLPVEQGLKLPGSLVIPQNATSIIITVHAAGTSRFSQRVNFIVQQLQNNRFATLVFDLLTEDESQQYGERFQIGMLTSRLIAVTRWVTTEILTANMSIGYFAAGTGASAAFAAAVEFPDEVGAIVSRGGRPDLVDGVTERLSAPVLLLVGNKDEFTVEINRNIYKKITCPKELQLIVGASHLFDEPGALDQVTSHAVRWFRTYL